MVLGVPAGYGLARSRFRGSGAITGWLIVAYIVPALVYIVPLYAIYTKFGLSGTYLSIILYYLTFELPFVVFMMRGYFSDLPRELEDAARVDGCSRSQAFRRIMLPMVFPGLSTVTILVCIMSWGEFFGALIFTGSSTITAPVAIEQYIGLGTSNWSALAAAAVFLVVPVLVLAGFVQRGLPADILVGIDRLRHFGVKRAPLGLNPAVGLTTGAASPPQLPLEASAMTFCPVTTGPGVLIGA